MSAAKMVADSTQSDLASQDASSDSRKRKKKMKKSVKKVVLPEDEDEDLDLKKDLKPISFYIKERATMIGEMFHSVRGASLQRALPELLKSLPLDELQALCLEQLEVMSKKRIQRILAGEESANISSSGTEDMDEDEEDEDSSDEENRVSGAAVEDGGVDIPSVESQKEREEEHQEVADSTSINEEHALVDIKRSESDSEQYEDKIADPPPPPMEEEVYIKQEPLDSEPERDGYGDNDDYDMDNDDRTEEEDDEEEDEDSVIEEGFEEPPETYTSGSEDGELVRKEVPPSDPPIKQEAMSEEDEAVGAGDVGTDVNNEGQDNDAEINENETQSSQEVPNVEQPEGDLITSVGKVTSDSGGGGDVEGGEAGGSGGAAGGGEGGEDVVLPSIMMDQMELLELEMRARAIKAMLMTSQQEEEGQEEDAAG